MAQGREEEAESQWADLGVGGVGGKKWDREGCFRSGMKCIYRPPAVQHRGSRQDCCWGKAL